MIASKSINGSAATDHKLSIERRNLIPPRYYTDPADAMVFHTIGRDGAARLAVRASRKDLVHGSPLQCHTRSYREAAPAPQLKGCLERGKFYIPRFGDRQGHDPCRSGERAHPISNWPAD